MNSSAAVITAPEVIKEALGERRQLAIAAGTQNQAPDGPVIGQARNGDPGRLTAAARGRFRHDPDTDTGARHPADVVETAQTDAGFQAQADPRGLGVQMIPESAIGHRDEGLAGEID